MKIGTTDATALYLGTTTIDKAYLGSTEVWSASVPLFWSQQGSITTFTARAAALGNNIFGGQVSDFTNYAANPVRTNFTNTYIEFIHRVSAWTTGNDYVAATQNRSYTYTINSLGVPHTSVTESTNANNNLVRVRFFGTAATIAAFWTANVATGNPVVFQVNYELV